MTKLALPCLVVHRGKVYQLNETVRHGLILQKAEQQKLVDAPKSTVYIVHLRRVTLRELRLPSHSPRMSETESFTLGLAACQEAHNDREGQMTQRTKMKKKLAKRNGKITGLHEVKKLKEPVVASFVHCGRPMKKLSGVSQATGMIATIYHCERCGAQQKPDANPAAVKA